MGLKLHLQSARPFRRVLIAFAEKHVLHQLVVVDMAGRRHREQPGLSLNPYGRVPTLEEDGFVLFESTAILIIWRRHGPLCPWFQPMRGRALVDMHMRCAICNFPDTPEQSFFPKVFCPRNDGIPLRRPRLRPRLRNTWRYSTSSLPARPTWLPNSSRLPRCATCHSWIFCH